jgi:hypothetical protein
MSNQKGGLSFGHARRRGHREGGAANRTEEAWKESTRRFNRNRHREYAQGWYDHHERQLAAHEETFGRLLAYHRAERDHYAAMLGINVPEDQADGPPPPAPPPAAA